METETVFDRQRLWDCICLSDRRGGNSVNYVMFGIGMVIAIGCVLLMEMIEMKRTERYER